LEKAIGLAGDSKDGRAKKKVLIAGPLRTGDEHLIVIQMR
jgi:hypothetical protein